METLGFFTILDFILIIYDMLNVTSSLVWNWFASPIESGVAEFLNIPLDTTNLEIMLGTFVPVMLTLSLASLVIKSIFP